MNAFWKKLGEKLSSRKLWAAVLAFLCAAAAPFFGEELSAENIEALRCASAAMIAYIFGEGAVDLARAITAQK